MTDEKVEKSEDNGEESKDEESPLDIVLEDIDTTHAIEDKTEDVKVLEDERPDFQLEFFTKEELFAKVDELKKQVEEQTPKLEKLIEEVTKLKKSKMHLQAEFENAQKRWDKSRQSLRTQHIASVIRSLLPLYDSFRKAIESKTEENKKEIESVQQFFNQFLNILKSYQAEPIEVKINDPFVYKIHEALTTIEKDDIPENSIIDIVQEGWKIGKEVLRYTKVVISKKPKPPEPEPPPESEEKEKGEQEVPEEKNME